MEQTQNNSFIFYRSFYEAVAELEDRELAACMRALCEYGLNDVERCDSMIAEIVLKMAKPQMDANLERRKNGSKGGRPKATEQKKNHRFSEGGAEENHRLEEETAAGAEEKPNENGNENENEKGNEKENGNGNGNGKGRASTPAETTTFSPPSLTEVSGYCREMGYGIDAAHFIDYYTGNGWMVGKNRMQDWKAVIRNWARQDAEKQKGAAYGKKQGSTGNWDDYNGIQL